MSYAWLLRDADVTGLGEWLGDAGELFVNLEFPHSPGSGDSFVVTSIEHLFDILEAVVWPEIEMRVFRRRQLPIRGVMDETLMTHALDVLPDRQWYAIVRLTGTGPYYCDYVATPQGHTELAEELRKVIGQELAIGLHPLENEQSGDWVDPEIALDVKLLRNRPPWTPYPELDRKAPWYKDGKRPGS